MAKLTLILGVHRSGTSLLCLGLQAAGVSAGTFNDIREPDNPLGYGEHHGIRNFNDKLLAHLGVSWDNWGFKAGEIDFTHADFLPWVSEAVALLKKEFPGDGPFVLKDPRISSLASFWERVVPEAGFDLRRILILRDPREVAESQRLRVVRRPREFPVIADVEPMAALWTVTMLEILNSLADDNTLLLRHADLLSDPATTLAAAAAFAGAAGSKDAIAEFAAEHVLPSLYRARVKRAPTGPWMRASISIFDALVALGSPHQLTTAEASLVTKDRPRLQQMLRGLSAARQSVARMRAVHEEQQARISALSALVWELAQVAAQTPDASVEEALGQAFTLAKKRNLAANGFFPDDGRAYTPLFDVADKRLQAWLKSTLPDYARLGLVKKPR